MLTVTWVDYMGATKQTAVARRGADDRQTVGNWALSHREVKRVIDWTPVR